MMPSHSEIRETLQETGVVSILVIQEAEDALRVGEALIAGGLPAMEITFRTEAARDGIDRLVREFPEALVGAGTVLTVDNLVAARDAGAQFVVTPGLNPTIVEKAVDIRLPIFPGIMTPSDVERGLAFGLDTLKFFPAETAGGVGMLKALAGPYSHTGVRFIPTGGIHSANLMDYLAVPIALACGGTWIAPKNLVEARDWKSIEENARKAVEAISRIRNPK
jgi:2-dehydro-3-deoxyphosphogluconate aldolase/(4S)-4-hydroxy-2-oxoglutarate aldolase